MAPPGSATHVLQLHVGWVLLVKLHDMRQEGADLAVDVLDEAPVVVGAHAREVRHKVIIPPVRRGQRRNGGLHGSMA